MSCDARRADAGSFSFWERRHLAPVLARCSTLLDGHGQHVGTIALPAHTRYYFYADDARLIVPIYEFCTDYAGLHLACAKADDPQQQTYFQLLYPDAAKRQSVANRSWIDARRAQGDDLQAPRRIDLTFSFPTAQARAAFSAEAASLGFTAGRVGFDEAQEAPYMQTLHASGIARASRADGVDHARHCGCPTAWRDALRIGRRVPFQKTSPFIAG